MADPIESDSSIPSKGKSLEEVAAMGPLPGVGADDDPEDRGENQSDNRDQQFKGFMVPGSSSDHSVR